MWLATISTVQPNYQELPACLFLLDGVCEGVLQLEQMLLLDESSMGCIRRVPSGLPAGTSWRHTVQEVAALKVTFLALLCNLY